MLLLDHLFLWCCTLESCYFFIFFYPRPCVAFEWGIHLNLHLTQPPHLRQTLISVSLYRKTVKPRIITHASTGTERSTLKDVRCVLTTACPPTLLHHSRCLTHIHPCSPTQMARPSCRAVQHRGHRASVPAILTRQLSFQHEATTAHSYWCFVPERERDRQPERRAERKERKQGESSDRHRAPHSGVLLYFLLCTTENNKNVI